MNLNLNVDSDLGFDDSDYVFIFQISISSREKIPNVLLNVAISILPFEMRLNFNFPADLL
jgi:hypothetical protein